VTFVAAVPDAHGFFTGSREGFIERRDGEEYVKSWSWRPQGNEPVDAYDVTPDGAYLAQLTQRPNRLRVMSLKSRQTVWELRDEHVRAFALRPDGQQVAIHRDGMSLEIWNVAPSPTRKILGRTALNSLPDFPFAYSRDGSMLAASWDEGRIYIWDTRD
jgi:WD40 repeat protein